MAQRNSLLPRLSRSRRFGAQSDDLRCPRRDLSPPPLLVLSGKPQFQGVLRCLSFCDHNRDRLLWAPHNPFWLPLSRRPVDSSAALPSARRRSVVAAAAAVLFVDQHSWLVVAWADPVFPDRSFGPCRRHLGTNRIH